ncbi:hypothetical protein TRFO_17872 [Tritrichomonas foetus]|uniref:Uncharacterized protein n=1 Tax=Tritrichomonas foetus TaxID=1144522 RepID=A0A1J4KMC4_9EUKA|nr:hypothetical protein TRFO_17872 [Tritrichomonas foetus]|eukprot:OHT12379.1 hypothetical protein TRFO_17872 [Tritrichomonas foetus]
MLDIKENIEITDLFILPFASLTFEIFLFKKNMVRIRRDRLNRSYQELEKMEFTIIFYCDPPFGALYHVNADELEKTFNEIKIDFFENVKENIGLDFDFDFNSCRIYALDMSNPLIAPPYTEITDLNLPISSIKYAKFDLLVSPYDPYFQPPTDVGFNELSAQNDETPGDSLIQEGFILVEAKDYHNALKIFQEVRELLPNDPRPIHYLIEILLKMHKYKQALVFAQSHVQIFPSDIRMQVLNAKAHYKNKNYKKSLKILRSIQSVSKMSQKDTQIINVLMVKNLIAMDCISEANILISTLRREFDTNIKLVKLSAKLEIAQGDLLEATKLVLSSLVYNPNYQDLQKFIGKYIIGYKAASIFMNEMFDCFKDPNQMFFLAKTFYDYGRCDQAHPCFVQAFMMQTKKPSMALMLLKNSIAKNLVATKIIEIVNCFLFASYPLVSFLFGTRNYNIDHIIGKPPVSDFNQETEKKPPSQMKQMKYENFESPFITSQLETIEIIMLLQIYLFTNGFISAAERLVPHNLLQFMLPRTIISKTARTSLLVLSFVPTIERPLPILQPIYVFGYESVVPIAYRTIDFRGTKMILQPIMIQDLSYENFAQKKNPAYFEFSRRIYNIPEYSTLIFEFGRSDCRKYVIEATKMIDFSSLREALLEPILSLVEGIKDLRSQRKLRILIHPVMVTGSKFHQRFIDFNKLLKEKIDELSNEIEELQFLDFYNEMLEETQNTLKEEFVYDNKIWNSNYLPIMEKYINTNMPKKPFPPIEEPLKFIDPDFE